MSTTKYDPREDVAYAISIGNLYLGFLDRMGIPVKGSCILELGPGKNYGSTIFLSCFGAHCTVADKYLSNWDENTHPIFYSALGQVIERKFPKADISPIKKLLQQNKYHPDVIQQISSPSEDLSSLPANYFDVVLSNAVLEHVVNPAASLNEIYRVTKGGGWNIHQIDYRDHRDYEQPLEYLFVENNDFAQMFKERNGECGNRYRAREFVSFFKNAGFLIDAVEHNMFAAHEYLVTTKERMAKNGMAYAEEDLSILSGRIYASKPVDSTVKESAVCRSGKKFTLSDGEMFDFSPTGFVVPKFISRLAGAFTR